MSEATTTNIVEPTDQSLLDAQPETLIDAKSELDKLLGKNVGDGRIRDLLFDSGALDHLDRIAGMMANARATIPKHLQGNKNDCMAIVMQAAQWGLDPFILAQKTYFVNGSIGYEAQLVNAVVIARAPISHRPIIQFGGNWDKLLAKDPQTRKSYRMDDCWVIISATIVGETEPRELRVSMAQAGTRNSPLWADDPQQQLAYLAIKRWARLYTPDVLLGVYSADELMAIEGSGDANRPQASSLNDRLRSKPTYDTEQALVDINACDSLEDLKSLGMGKMSGAKWASNDDADQVRSAYVARRAMLTKAQAEADDKALAEAKPTAEDKPKAQTKKAKAKEPKPEPVELSGELETLAQEIIDEAVSDPAKGQQLLDSCELSDDERKAIQERLNAATMAP